MKIAEPLLEPLVRYLRFGQALTYIPKEKPLRVCDLGCGPHFPFYYYLVANKMPVKAYVGIDPLAKRQGVTKEVRVVRAKFEEIPTIYEGKADLAVAFAVLEHVESPEKMMRVVKKLLKPGGTIIFTTPTHKAKYILEFLSYKLNLISRREIEEHKQYFDRAELLALTTKVFPDAKVVHKYFELGMNNMLVITDKKK